MFSSSVISSFAIRERAGCFTLIVVLMSCQCWCSVVLPHCAMGWSAVCDLGISFSYSLTILSFKDTRFKTHFMIALILKDKH